MGEEEDFIMGELDKISMLKKCPKCSELSLVNRHNSLQCDKCGYTEQMPSIK